MKILILLMSCNKPLYLEEETACRETFLKDVYDYGVPYLFYKGLNEEHNEQGIDYDTQTIYVDAPDDLAGTGRKTALALRESLDIDYDYLIKTNVSTYINIENVMRWIETWPGKDDTNIYGSRFIVNKASLDIPFPRGNFVIMSRKMVEGSLDIMDKLVGKDGIPKTDDTLVGLSMLYYQMKKLELDYIKSLKVVPTVFSFVEPIADRPEFFDALAVRCKNEAEREKTPENMRKVYDIYRGSVIPERNGFRQLEILEVGDGVMMAYDKYCKARVSASKTNTEENKK